MSDRIENRYTGVGQPDDIFRHGKPLDNRQQKVLDKLPETNCRAMFKKEDVSMFDLSALTAKTDDEFAMFTLGGERVVMRGDSRSVEMPKEDVERMVKQGYKWSGHTHPGGNANALRSSSGDRRILKAFKQETSVIYNSVGQYQTFTHIGLED